MISYQEALNIISNAVPGAPVLEDIVTGMAQGRVLAEEVISHVDNPPFRAAAMDGFALVAAETQSASPESPLAFPVAGCIAAGDGCGSVGESNYSSGRAFEIMTGAVVPAWCDCVVRVEDVSLVSGQPDETRTVVIKRPVFRGENVRSRGEDFCSGQPILRAGVVLLPHHLMLCQAGGVKMVRVQRKPRVGVLTTGKELIDGRTSKEEPLPEGKIFNSCGIFLRSALTMLGAAHADYGSVP
ncbi:MAG TPA: hypothetical protein PLP17_12250, partial [Oligoflexia bacterium]|nr:hypothetical protein [Oligoflexia bacterium]